MLELKSISDAVELSKTKPVILIVSGEDCKPCKRMKSMLEGLTDEEKAEGVLAEVKAEDNVNDIRALGIRSVPTMLFYTGGSVSGVLVGEQSKDKVTDKIKNLS